MRLLRTFAAVGIAFFGLSLPEFSQARGKTIYDFKVKSIRGESVDLSHYRGKVLLIVNTASECGYTPQYKGLQELYVKYRDQGLEVLGFPSNDFGGQEPGSNSEIKRFCEINYGVKFPLFEKGAVSGKNAQPLFGWLTHTEAQGGTGEIQWNFEKFLVGPNGAPIKRFRSGIGPDSQELQSAIEESLKKKAP